MERSILFRRMLRALRFRANPGPSPTTARLRRPPWPTTHINKIIYLRDRKNYSANVAFDGDGPTAPLPMNEATVHNNLGSQQVRFVHDRIDKQQRSEARISTYRYRNGP
ncbi:hypothetical protein MY3296_009324 [Beauveria thailandica]